MRQSWSSRSLRLAAVAAVAALLSGGCGGDDDAGTGAAPAEAADAALATAIRIDDSVDARVGAADFAAVGQAVDVAIGDVVRTDRTGFAEVDYFDGSLTRLDVDTEFEVVALRDDPKSSEVRTRMGLGRTYHRVETLTGDDTYAVETSVATATVRGTAFMIRCTSTACAFFVLDGTVDVEVDATGETVSVGTGQALIVPTDEEAVADPQAVPIPSGATDDRWVDRNLDLDTEQGYDPIEIGELAAPGAAPNSESPTCVMNGSTGGGWAATFEDEPVNRVPSRGPGGEERFAFTNGTAATAGPNPETVTVMISPSTVVFFGPAGNVGTSNNDGGTYDFAEDGSGARVIDERPASPDIPAVSIDVTITCTP